MDTPRIWARRIKEIGQVIWPILRRFYHRICGAVKRFRENKFKFIFVMGLA
jgi:hypothetical protein